MKKVEVLERADALCKNLYSAGEKLSWCAELDENLKADYLREEELSGTDLSEDTAVGAPYDLMYVDFVMAKCCYYQRDYDAYNQHITAFRNKLSDFSNHHIRENLPVRKTKNQVQNWWC